MEKNIWFGTQEPDPKKETEKMKIRKEEENEQE